MRTAPQDELSLANGSGDSVDRPTTDDIRAMMMALDPDDEEHGEVWLVFSESFDQISWLVDGRLQLRRPDDTIRSILHITHERAIEVFALFAAADFDALESLAWQPGDGDPRMREELQHVLPPAHFETMTNRPCPLDSQPGPHTRFGTRTAFLGHHQGHTRRVALPGLGHVGRSETA